jgi:YihY family inner membrane protein
VRRIWRGVRAFWWKAFGDNLTGLSAMVAYNLLLSIIPVGLLGLFVAGRILQSPELEQSVLKDLRELFPSAAESTLSDLLRRIRGLSTSIGIAALVASVWIGSSFWGALDTAFCQIYHLECRSWVRQKRFALIMLGLVLVFMAATIAVPTLQSILVSGASELPFGLADVRAVIFGLTLAAGLFLLFAILCAIYWLVPNRRRIPWRAIWPGALGATLAIALVDYAFPFYLQNVASFAGVGTTLIFILIVLFWFYAVAIIILGGAVINALRFERHDAGNAEPAEAGPDLPQAGQTSPRMGRSSN